MTRAQGDTTAQDIAADWIAVNAVYTEDVGNVSIITNEVPAGTINGSNDDFTTASAYQSGSLKVFKNGVRMKGGGADYTEVSGGFTMVTPPATGTVLLVDYLVGGSGHTVGTNSNIVDETPTGTINSSNTAFTASRAFIGGSLVVYLNGVRQTHTSDYTETTPASGTFAMVTAPVTGDVLRIDYQYNLNPSSNADTVDGIHANTTATGGQLYPLNSNAKISSGTIEASGNIQSTTLSGAAFTTTSTSYTDYTSLSVTITTSANTSGKVLLSLYIGWVDSTVDNLVYAAITDSSNTVLVSSVRKRAATNNGEAMTMFYPVTGLSASTSYTYKCRVKVAAGTGTYNSTVITNGATIMAQELI
jgi:hypothetical protein